MTRIFALVLGSLAFSLPVWAAEETYPPHPDSQVQAGVPKGEVLKFAFEKSHIFPGTTRNVTVYVPRQYDGQTPACVYVNQDGVQYHAPQVFDNLIAKKEMPVTIGIFVSPGRVPAVDSNVALDRFNRSLEYDGLGPDYANFLLTELLPEVETMSTSDGRAIKLSKLGNDRMIAGSSSGAIAAFTAAWERPDAFSRVFSSIGTYVGLRGGHVYPTLIRKFEPKPLRVFLQDGANDNNIYGGDWWMANQEMERAFVFAGYEVNHVWGEGGHNGKHATAIFPDAIRWLWKDWPAPVKAGKGSPQLQDLLAAEDAGWEKVPGAKTTPRQGWKLPDGTELGVDREAVTQDGRRYRAGSGAVVEHVAGGKNRRVAELPFTAAGVCLSPDQTLLYVAEANSQWVWSLQRQADGTFAHLQRFYHLHLADAKRDAVHGRMAVDEAGRLYVVTQLGLQICDQAGRVNIIIPGPGAQSFVWDVAFSAEDPTSLYICNAEGVYRRRLKVKGAFSTHALKPAPPKL